PMCFSILLRHPETTRLPYTTLFRSQLLGIGKRITPEPHDPLLRAFRNSASSGASGFSSSARLAGALQVPCVPTVARSAQRSQLRSEEHTSELQSRVDLVCRLLLEKK